MKKYNVKYEVGQEVYILESKKISKTVIDKIRITEQKPYMKGNSNGTYTEMDGIKIDYLIETKRTKVSSSYD